MGYSFKWILEHISQSFQTGSYALTAGTASWAGTASYAGSASYALSASYTLSASYAQSASYAATASFITASNVYGPYGSSSIRSASYALTASYALNGGTGGGTPGGANTTIQFNSGGFFSGSSNYTFVSSSNSLRLTGSMYVSGAISASYSASAVGFFGTSSWAISASWAPLQTNISGEDLYITRFSGSSGIVTSSFVNSASIDAFISAKQDITASNQSFMIGSSSKHVNTVRATAFGEYVVSNANTASFASGKATGTSNNYDAAFNYLSQTAPKFQFKGYSSRVFDAGYPTGLHTVLGGGNITSGSTVYGFTEHIQAISIRTPTFIIYDHQQDKLVIHKTAVSASNNAALLQTDFTTYTGMSALFDNALYYTDGTVVADTETGLFSLWAVPSWETITTTIGNFTNGVGNSAYGTATHAEGIGTTTRGHATHATNVGSVVHGSGSFANNLKNAVWSNHSTAVNTYNASGIVVASKQTITTTDGDGNNATEISIPDGFSLKDFLTDYGYTDSANTFQVIIVIPQSGYCDIVPLYTQGGKIYTPYILPIVNATDSIRIVLPNFLVELLKAGSSSSYYDGREVRDLPHANFVMGIGSISSNSASFAGGLYSRARGSGSFAFGTSITANHHNAFVFGSNTNTQAADSFTVGFNTQNLVINNSGATITDNLTVVGKTYLGNDITDRVAITGSLGISGSSAIAPLIITATTTPPAVAGGIYFDGTDFYLGFP